MATNKLSRSILKARIIHNAHFTKQLSSVYKTAVFSFFQRTKYHFDLQTEEYKSKIRRQLEGKMGDEIIRYKMTVEVNKIF